MSGAIGAILREERLARGIDFEDVEQATKIRARYIEAIEAERWEVLPGRAYARAFLRTYAELLEVDPEPLLAELERDLATAEADEELPPEPVVQRGTLPGGPTGRFWRRLAAVVAAVLVVVAIAAVALTADDEGGEPGPEPGTQAEEPSDDPETEADETAVEPPPERVTVSLAATGEVWVCLVDGSGEALVNSEVLAAGEERGPFEARRVLMNLGNGQIEVTADDEAVELVDPGEPIGFEISSDGVDDLSPEDRPSCT